MILLRKEIRIIRIILSEIICFFVKTIPILGVIILIILISFRRNYCLIDDILCQSFQEALHILDGNIHESCTSLTSSPSNVGRDICVCASKERIIRCGRFTAKHIGTIGIDFICEQCLCHIGFIYQRSTSCVDNHRSRFHSCDTFLADEVAGAVCEWAMECEEVGTFEEYAAVHLLDVVG